MNVEAVWTIGGTSTATKETDKDGSNGNNQYQNCCALVNMDSVVGLKGVYHFYILDTPFLYLLALEDPRKMTCPQEPKYPDPSQHKKES